MTKTCSELFQGMDCTIIGNGNEEVAGLAFRSDEVRPNDMFFCIVGTVVDGHSFAQDAIDRGATSLVAERKVYLADATDVTEVVVSDSRKAMAYASANYYDNPSRAFSLVGITGTNGKTTTTYLVEHIASVAGNRCGVIGTVGNKIAGAMEHAERTTPESPDLQKLFARMRDAGCTVYNFSKGGMSAKCYCESFAEENDFWNIEKRCQAYIMALGVNDVSQIIGGEYELGTIDDIDTADYKNNAETFAGWYAQIIQRYKENQPKAKFFLMTMPKEPMRDEKRKELNAKHNRLMYQLAELFDNCYVLDLCKYAPEYDEEFKKNFYLAGHLNAAGYRLTALMVESYIDYIIRHNPEDFKQVGFVGTPFYNEDFKW